MWTEDIDEDSRLELDTSLSQVKSVLGSDSPFADREIKDILWDSYFDVAGALDYFTKERQKRETRERKKKQKQEQQQQQHQQQPQPGMYFYRLVLLISVKGKSLSSPVIWACQVQTRSLQTQQWTSCALASTAFI